MKLNDITLPGIPDWAKMGDDPAKAVAVCKRDKLGYQEKCSSHDRSVSGLESNGQRVMFMATGTAINPRDKSIREGQRVWLTLDSTDGGGLFNAATAEGADYILSAYTQGSYTPSGVARLRTR